MQQAGRRRGVAAQHANAPLPVADRDGGKEVVELLPRPEAVVVVGAVQDQQVAALLQGIVDVAHEVAGGGEVMVLDADLWPAASSTAAASRASAATEPRRLMK